MANAPQARSPVLVAAIDFGTTYSGYAFSFKSAPYTVHTNTWNAGTSGLMSLKAPTCILLNPAGKFDSFGYEAENKYNDLVTKDAYGDWRLFRRFKMMLHTDKTLSRTSPVDDVCGRPAEALPIFTMAIRYLKDHLLAALATQAADLPEKDIQYVLTVPAIWDDKAKQFMREAAMMAGIDTTRLKLALEPEAASIWCEKTSPELSSLLSMKGTRYMVLDLGGGTADITVFEKKADGTLKQIHRASGGPWGGIYVDKAYLQTLTDIFGAKAIENLKRDSNEDYLDMMRDFEVKKRAFTLDSEGSINIRVPSLLRKQCEKNTGQNLAKRLKSLKYGNDITLSKSGDKVRIEREFMQSWFEEPINHLVKHLKEILCQQTMISVQNILLVGGFGESEYVRRMLGRELSGKRVIVPPQAGLVVLKGAVRFGHEPCIVSSRIMKESYGIRVRKACVPVEHAGAKKRMVNGKLYVENIFLPFINANEEVHVKEVTLYEGLKPTDMFSTGVPIFKSPRADVTYTTEPECSEIGKLLIQHPEGNTLDDKKMDVSFIFGGTELLVRCRLQKTGNEALVKLDFLD